MHSILRCFEENCYAVSILYCPHQVLTIDMLFHYIEGRHLIQGIGAGIIPSILDVELLDEVIQVSHRTD